MKYTQEEYEKIDRQLDLLTECINEIEHRFPETNIIIDKYLKKIGEIN